MFLNKLDVSLQLTRSRQIRVRKTKAQTNQIQKRFFNQHEKAFFNVNCFCKRLSKKIGFLYLSPNLTSAYPQNQIFSK